MLNMKKKPKKKQREEAVYHGC